MSVTQRVNIPSSPPILSEYDVYLKIKSAKKTKGYIPGDLPRDLVKEFSPELAGPVSTIFNNIISTAQWPTMWKTEYVIPLPKIQMPESEDDLRPISLTNFFSKVLENFVFGWLLQYIEKKIDFRQYGALKGNSVCHYLIELLNFILWNQESQSPSAVLTCLIDFSKAFNRLNHNIIISKLSGMEVPTWLLKLVMGFLSNRRMLVRYRGKLSAIRNLPGGTPQGTLLGLLLFIIQSL